MDDHWTASEKKTARRIFEIARARAHQAAVDHHSTRKIEDIDDLWEYQEELGKLRREMDAVLDYRYSVILSTLASCIRRGWLQIDEVSELSEERIARVKMMAEL